MANAIKRKTGDNRAWKVRLKSSLSTDDLSTVLSVSVFMKRKSDGSVVINGESATIDSALANLIDITFAPQAAAVATAGRYYIEYHATFPGAITSKWPSNGVDVLDITDDIP